MAGGQVWRIQRVSLADWSISETRKRRVDGAQTDGACAFGYLL